MGGPAGVLVMRGTDWLRKAGSWLGSRLRRHRAHRTARSARHPGRATLRRTWIEAELSARLAVRSGVRIDDFLRARVARYAATLPVPLDELGVNVSRETGDPEIRARATRPHPGTPRESLARSIEPTPAALRSAREEVSALAGRVAAARIRVDAMALTVSDDLASGKLPATPGQIEASLEQCGRPPVPHPAPQLLLRSLSFALLASLAYQMAGPALAVAGLSTDDLAGGFAREPISMAAGILFGLGAAVSVYVFLNAAVERWQQLAASASAARRPLVLAAAGGSAAVLSGAAALAAVRPGPASGPVLLVCVPLAVVLLLRQAGRLQAQRAGASAAALYWDRARAREAGERARRTEGLASAEAVLASTLRAHASAEERLRGLERQAAEEAREAERLATESVRRVQRLAEVLAAALELDRYAYLRRAAALARDGAAVRPIRSRPASVDPGRLEAAG